MLTRYVNPAYLEAGVYLRSPNKVKAWYSSNSVAVPGYFLVIRNIDISSYNLSALLHLRLRDAVSQLELKARDLLYF
jgi:hypothetical protein